MDDRALLEAAAKAAGYRLDGMFTAKNPNDMLILNERGGHTVWNPLAYDGDALRLAVKLEIGSLYCELSGEAEARFHRGSRRLTEYGPDDPCAATRRAIVRAAAAIGEGA